MADWSAIRRANRKASARKAKRERLYAERVAMHERLGGVVTVGELRAAKRVVRVVPGGYGTPFDCEVWTFRGREWRIEPLPDEPAALPHLDYRTDLNYRDGWVPLTAGAKKWVVALWESERQAADGA